MDGRLRVERRRGYGINNHIRYSFLFAINDSIQPDEPVFGNGDGHGEFQFRGHLECECGVDLDCRCVHPSGRIHEYTRNNHCNVHAGHFEGGHDDRDRNSRIGNDHVGICRLLAINDSIQPDEHMLGNGDGHRELQFRGHVECKCGFNFDLGLVHPSGRIHDHARNDHRDLDAGHDEVGRGNGDSESGPASEQRSVDCRGCRTSHCRSRE